MLNSTSIMGSLWNIFFFSFFLFSVIELSTVTRRIISEISRCTLHLDSTVCVPLGLSILHHLMLLAPNFNTFNILILCYWLIASMATSWSWNFKDMLLFMILYHCKIWNWTVGQTEHYTWTAMIYILHFIFFYVLKIEIINWKNTSID